MFPLLHSTKAEQLETARTENIFILSELACCNNYLLKYFKWTFKFQHSDRDLWMRYFITKKIDIFVLNIIPSDTTKILSKCHREFYLELNIECFQNKYLTVCYDWIQQLLFRTLHILKNRIARVMESIAKKEIRRSWVKVCSIPCKRKEVVEQEKEAGNVLMTWTRHGEDGTGSPSERWNLCKSSCELMSMVGRASEYLLRVWHHHNIL